MFKQVVGWVQHHVVDCIDLDNFTNEIKGGWSGFEVKDVEKNIDFMKRLSEMEYRIFLVGRIGKIQRLQAYFKMIIISK